MSDIKRILVPLDGSDLAEQAIPYATALAKHGAELLFIHVASSIEPVRDLLGRVAVDTDDVKGVETNRWTQLLKDAAGRAPGLDPDSVTYLVAEGDYATEILKAVEANQCDFLIAASRGRGAVGRLAFGSVADRLARASTVPIMIVRPQDADVESAPPVIRRIVVPYDGSELAAAAFPVAVSLAKELSASIHLVQALSAITAAPFAAPMEPFYSAEVYDQVLTDLETEAKAGLESARDTLIAAGVETSYELVSGSPYEVIAERTNAEDLIVMTSHGRGGIRRWLIGSVAEKLVREGPVPVVLVPSAGRAGADQES